MTQYETPSDKDSVVEQSRGLSPRGNETAYSLPAARDKQKEADRRKEAPPDSQAVAAPFEGHPRGDDKTRLLSYLLYTPKGCPIARLTKAVLPSCSNKEISERDYSSTDYQFVRRFCENCEYVELDRESSVLTASPSTGAFHLTGVSKFPTESAEYAKDRSEALIHRIRDLNNVNNAKLLAKDFLSYLESIDDRRLMLQEEKNADMKLTMPYHTRFNNKQREKEQWARYNTAWDIADAKYSKGLMLTLTTDPKRFDSLAGMVDSLMSSWGDLHEALNQKFGGCVRLDYIRALEFGGSKKSNTVGLPHLHVCIFGVPYIDHSWLSAYWNKKHAEVTHIQSLHKRGNESWVISQGKDAGKSAAGYLGKYLSKTFESIGQNIDDLYAEVKSWNHRDHKNAGIWKIALYWATGRQFWDCSHDLKDNLDPDRLEEIPGLGEKKISKLNEADIHTLSDVRLADTDDIAAIDGISEETAEKMEKAAGQPSAFDIYSFEFVGAAKANQMPPGWSSARHYGIGPDPGGTAAD
jgi:hypothetical protein